MANANIETGHEAAAWFQAVCSPVLVEEIVPAKDNGVTINYSVNALFEKTKACIVANIVSVL